MTRSLPRRLSALTLLALAVGVVRADAPKPAGKDAADDELPAGAKIRFGSSRLVFRSGFAPVPPDFKTILTADGGGFRRHDVATGAPLDPTRRGGLGLGGVLVSADGKRVVGLHTGILTVRGAVTGAEIKQLHPPAGFGTATVSGHPTVAFSRDGKVLAQGGTGANGKGEVVVWDVDKGEPRARLETKLPGPAIPSLSADGKLVATRPSNFNTPLTPPQPGGAGEQDPARVIQVWDAAAGKELFQARVVPPGYQQPEVVLAPDGSLLAVSFGDGPVDLWDVKEKKLRQTLLGRTGQGLRLAFSPDGKTLAAAAQDGTIQRWTVADGKPAGTTEPPAVPVRFPLGIAFADNERVVAWGLLGTVGVLWESPSGKVLTPVGEHTAAIKSIAFANGGKELVTSATDGTVARWDAATGKSTKRLTVRSNRVVGAGPAPAPPGFGVVLTPDGSRGVSTFAPAAVYDLATGAELFVIPRGGPYQGSAVCAPTADGTKVVSVVLPYQIGNIKVRPAVAAVWDVVAGKKVAELEMPIATLQGVAVSPDGTRLVTAAFPQGRVSGSGLVYSGWSLKTGKLLAEAEDKTWSGPVTIAAASDTSAVVSSGPGRLWALDFAGGKVGEEIDTNRNTSGEYSSSTPVVFNADGTRFAAGVATATPGVYGVRVYDWPRGRPLHTFAGHTGPVTALAFTPDGKGLASGSADTTVILWDLAAVKEPK